MKLEYARGQCYDGAAAMAGRKKGVATVIKRINPKCLYTHCYGHALNLAVGDSVKNVKLLSDSFGTIKEICNLVKKSPKRETHLKLLRQNNENENCGVHSFCPTRWTIRGQSCKAMIDNYDELMQLWEWSLGNVKDTEMKARIRGVQTYMQQFKFIFGCKLGKMILVHTDNLSRTLQASTCTAVEGQDSASCTVKALKSIRNDESFSSFWKIVKLDQDRLGINDPSLPRKKRRPEKVDNYFVPITYHHPVTTEEMYRQIYFDAIDNATQTITDRFDQPDWVVYRNMQQIFLKAFKGESFEEELDNVCETFGDDLDKDELTAQLEVMRVCSEEPIDNAKELVSFLQSLNAGRKRLMPQVVVLAKLLLVMPATNAVSERSFSALKRVKTYMRATTTSKRLNNLMVIHIHKDMTDRIDLCDVGKSFIWKENRHQVFGKFTKNDSLPKNISVSKSTQTIQT